MSITQCKLLMILLLAHTLSPAQKGISKPNIVFIYTDDQRFDAMSIVQMEQGKKARFPYLKTPNMDRIAKEGVRFRNAFVTLSLCSPSRAAILTGRYNHLNGIIDNYHPFRDSVTTFPSMLKKAGYTTGYIGKWHMGSQSGKRPGFDYSASYLGHGRYNDCPFEVNGNNEPTIGWVDDKATDYALDFIKQHKDGPFLVMIGYKSPHATPLPPARYTGLYNSDLLTKPVNERSKSAYVSFDKPGYAGTDKELYSWTDSNASRVKPYFRTVAGVDDNVGRVLDLLKELKLDNNTIVVFTSDNGYFQGEHGLYDKRAAYEESMRVPLLIKYPAIFPKGALVDEMVLNIDLPSTLLDLAGVQPPEVYQGKSITGIIGKNKKKWRTSFFYEYFYESNAAVPTILAVRTDDYKLIKYPGQEDWTELFDLKRDPYEMTNLYNNKAYVDLKNKMEAELKKLEEETMYSMPRNAQKRPLDENGRYLPYSSIKKNSK